MSWAHFSDSRSDFTGKTGIRPLKTENCNFQWGAENENGKSPRGIGNGI